MVKFNWVGYNKKTGIYYIRSYHYVLRLIDAKSNVRVNYNLTDLNRKKIRALTGAALFGYFAYLQLIKLRYRRHVPVYKMGCTAQGTKLPSFYEVANRVVANAVGIAISTASELKKLAHNMGYLRVKKYYGRTTFTQGAKELYGIYSAHYGRKNNIRYINGHYRLEEVDKIEPKVQFIAPSKKYYVA
jgi:hypothetical protein